MSAEYAEYLAANVLNEQQLVSYRSLSRALKVHVNLAKQMLFDFHQKQNAKKPGSVHATYLVTGTRTPPKPQQHVNADTQDGDDAVMQSSPPIPNSSAPQASEEDAEPTPVRSVLLVKEEHLDQAKATFEQITGIHVYSLAAGGLSDLNSLTECNRKIAVECASEDPLQVWKQYGTIQNPNVKRRTQKRPPPPPSTSVAKEAPAPAKAKPAAPTLEKQATKASNESEPNSARATPIPEKNTDATKKKTATKPATLKRDASSIFKSFAKGANKPKQPASTESSAAPSPAPAPAAAEDESMGGMSDDDIDNAADDEEIEVDAGTGRSKKDREADLKAMMDVDDEEMEDVADEASDNAIDAPKYEEKEESKESTQEEPKETMTVENGRRRGRRRIMKKKTVKDDEGYLVTREEAAWESFSEDEPAPKKAKPTPAPAPAVKGAAKKSAAKPGQGSIMSFFGKK